MAESTSEELLGRIVAAFQSVRGVRAIVLGGSRGRGVHHAASDYDVGLYYEGDLDIAGLESAARSIGGGRGGPADKPLMTPRGGWGAWVDGGGWLTIDDAPVDILYRDVARVERVIAACRAGTFECAYHYGHPHAFVSTMYAGEIATCRAFLRAQIGSMPHLHAILALGKIAHDSVCDVLEAKKSLHPFVHGKAYEIGRVVLVASYHCSRYNTNTGVLTEKMFDAVVKQAKIAAMAAL